MTAAMMRRRNPGPLFIIASAFAVPLVVNQYPDFAADLSGGLAVVVTMAIPFALISFLAGVWSTASRPQIIIFVLFGLTAGMVADLALHPLTETGFERNLWPIEIAIWWALALVPTILGAMLGTIVKRHRSSGGETAA